MKTSRLVIISDTHSYHRQISLPDGDVLIHCGDITFNGELDVFQDFANWMAEQSHHNKLVIKGNHELGHLRSEKGRKANEMLKKVSVLAAGRVPLIGVGGIFDGPSAAEKLSLGADLIQVYSGLIYEGPFLVKNILRYLEKNGPGSRSGRK